MVVGPPGTGKTDTAVQILQVGVSTACNIHPLSRLVKASCVEGYGLTCPYMGRPQHSLAAYAVDPVRCGNTSHTVDACCAWCLGVQVLYNNCPGQRTLLITHSNQALNDLFSKMVARYVPPSDAHSGWCHCLGHVGPDWHQNVKIICCTSSFSAQLLVCASCLCSVGLRVAVDCVMQPAKLLKQCQACTP